MKLIRELAATGGTDKIYAAMDTDDKAKVVTAAMSALTKTSFRHVERNYTKSKEASKTLVEQANIHYDGRYCHIAMHLYNKALAYAPNRSKQMMLAYAGRSKVMFTIRNFTDCQEDIKKCLSMRCPKSLAEELQQKSDLAGHMSKILVPKTMNTNLADSSASHQFRFDCKRNADVPCVSADVTFVNKTGAKQVTAGKDISAGTVVAMEHAFVSCVADENMTLTCYYCNRLTPSLHPCEGCCVALFCSKECRYRSMKEYHRIECHILGYLGTENAITHTTLVTRTAIKLSLELGWDALIAASEDIGASRMRTATVRQTYNSEEPLSMLSYDDDVHFFEGKIFNGSLNIARILYYLDQVPDYLPADTSKRAAAKEALSRIMLHLYVTFNKVVRIKCAVQDDNSWWREPEIHTTYGLFSMASKLKHSCDPNLMVVGLNDSVLLVATRTIKEGEALTITFIDHFYSYPAKETCCGPHRRATSLLLSIGHICTNCRVCEEDWDKGSDDIPIVMTEKQALLYEKLGNHKNIEERYKTASEILDEFPPRSSAHRVAYVAMNIEISIIQRQLVKNIIVS